MRAPRLSRIALLGLALVSLAGCDVIADATSPIDRDTLIDDMSQQLDRGATVLYHADYQLAGGHRGIIGQQVTPRRAVYSYPGGMLLVDGAMQTQCDTAVTPAKCQMRAMELAGSGPPASFAEATKHGLMTAPVVNDLLRVTSLQPGAAVKPHETTIAGQQASCLEISGLLDAPSVAFTVCVTADGVLASFTGVVNGANVDQALIQVSRRVTDTAFGLPSGAQVVDLRPQPTSSSLG